MKSQAPKKLSEKQKLAARMAASGKTQVEVAKELAYSPSRLSIIWNSEIFQEELEQLRMENFKDPQKRINALLPDALKVLAETLRDPNAKRSDKMRAASYLVDRALGKPKAAVEVSTKGPSLLAQFYENVLRSRATPPRSAYAP